MQRSGGSWFKASHETLSQKHLHKNKAGAVAQGVGPEFKPQYHKKKKKYADINSSSSASP
jgi:hypothetical protein